GLRTYTIDDETTEDMDDALSIEQTESGYRLGIHISDVASFIPIGSALDEESKRRATSIYCPERTVHMLPEELAEGILSLRKDEPRRCISCICSLTHEFELKNFEIRPTLIRVTERYTYEEVERMLF